MNEEVGVIMLDILMIVDIVYRGFGVIKCVYKIVGLVKVGYKGVGVFGMVVGKVIGKVSGFVVIVGIGFDIWMIVFFSKDISNGLKLEFGEGIIKYILELEKLMNIVEKYFLEMYGFNYW